MDIQLKRGLLDVCVLATIKNEDSYGYQIIKDIKPYVDISESTLYPILRRLEEGCTEEEAVAAIGLLRGIRSRLFFCKLVCSRTSFPGMRCMIEGERRGSVEKAWQTLCAVALAAGSFLFGSPDGLLLTLLAFVLMDYATGLLAAVCARRVSSAVGFRGLLRKMLILAMVGMGHLLDTQLLHAQGLLRNAVIGFYLANEGLSILENAGRMGLPLPEKLRTVLVQLKTEKGKDEKR